MEFHGAEYRIVTQGETQTDRPRYGETYSYS